MIATTTLGAQAGYAALWIILLSCFIKPVVQAEMGRYSIGSGETALSAFNRLPGPRIGFRKSVASRHSFSHWLRGSALRLLLGHGNRRRLARAM